MTETTEKPLSESSFAPSEPAEPAVADGADAAQTDDDGKVRSFHLDKNRDDTFKLKS
jgi:hypothetical protein